MKPRVAYDASALFAPEILLATQSPQGPTGPCTQERALLGAVLHCALDDLRTGRTRDGGRPIPTPWGGARGRRQPRRIMPPRDYLLSHDRAYPLSFENVCDHLGLAADDIRAMLRRKGLL